MASTVCHLAAKKLIFLGGKTTPYAQFQAAMAEDIQGGDAFRNAHDMIVWQNNDGMAETQILGALAGCGEEGFRTAGVRVLAHEMVFHEPGAVKAQGVGEANLIQCFMINLGLAAAEMGRYGEFVEEINIHRVGASMTSTASTPPQMYERLQIAILTSEQMHLHWADAGTGTHFMEVVTPLEWEETADGDYLRCRVLAEGLEVRIRVDLIQNLPIPVK